MGVGSIATGGVEMEKPQAVNIYERGSIKTTRGFNMEQQVVYLNQGNMNQSYLNQAPLLSQLPVLLFCYRCSFLPHAGEGG